MKEKKVYCKMPYEAYCLSSESKGVPCCAFYRERSITEQKDFKKTTEIMNKIRNINWEQEIFNV